MIIVKKDAWACLLKLRIASVMGFLEQGDYDSCLKELKQIAADFTHSNKVKFESTIIASTELLKMDIR